MALGCIAVVPSHQVALKPLYGYCGHITPNTMPCSLHQLYTPSIIYFGSFFYFSLLITVGLASFISP
jgi:hypothetical protein